MLRKFFRKHPRITQFTCNHITSDYVGQCVKSKEEQYPVYQCSICGMYKIGDKYWDNPFKGSKWNGMYMPRKAKR